MPSMDDRYYSSEASDTASIESTTSATSSDSDTTASSANTIRFAPPLSNAVHRPVTPCRDAFSIDTLPSPSPKSNAHSWERLGRFFKSRRVRVILWAYLTVLCAFQLVILVIIIWFLRLSAKSLDTSTLEFAMYKNTNFKDCAASTPVSTNCSKLNTYDLNVENDTDFLSWSLEHNGSFLVYPNYPQYPDPNNSSHSVSYTWCELASCLNGFKVIPSSPYPSAFSYSNILVWSTINMMAISGIWSMRKRVFGGDHKQSPCKREGILDWIFHAYDLCSFILWWCDFGRLAERPYYASVVSIWGWFTPFRYSINLNHHPYSCWLKRRPNLKGAIISTFYLVTLTQWIATVYFMRLRHYDLSGIWQINLFPKYGCLQSQISNATGTSVCSPEQLCAKDWLFTDIGFGKLGNSANTASLGIYGVGFYFLMVLIVFAFLASVGFWVYGKMHGNQRSWRDLRDTFVFAINIALVAFFASIPIILVMWVDGFMVYSVTTGWKAWDRSAAVTYDLECRAVHVGVSPWLQYLDVPNHGWEQRIVKMWFNS